jgi:hypothetical protein
MIERLHQLALLVWAAALTVTPLWAQEGTAPPFAHGGTAAGEPAPVNQWLDEVRAQRRAWEERRRAAKEALDARRRWLDPWGAAQKEAHEKDTQRRRDAFREQIERDRELFRNRSPWAAQSGPWQEVPPGGETLAPDPGGPAEGAIAPPDEDALGSPYPPLPGWDNRWYYRGY